MLIFMKKNANALLLATRHMQDSTLIFEDTYQVGQVNFNFYLPDTILTCPAKSVIEWT